jgi:hypothetical protein
MMTLEQTTRRILAAVEVQDLGALEAASKEREAAIAGLPSIPATPELRDAVAASIAAGEEARSAMRVIKQRLRHESRRLTHIENGFVSALRAPVRHQIDCKA